MKRLFFLLPVLCLCLSCHYITGSGNIISENRVTGGFTGVSVAGGFEVEWKDGPATTVLVEADDNVLPYIETRVSGGVLKIRTRGMNSFSNAHMKVFITSPDINSVTVSAAASFIAKDILRSDGRLKFNASSAGSITAEINAPEVDAEASSAATLKIIGKTRNCTADLSSGSTLRTEGLLTENYKVTASSGSNAHVRASVSLDASANSGSSIFYRGAANVQKSTSSGGSIQIEGQ